MRRSSDILAAILDNPTDLAHVRSLTSDDVTYVSLNFDHPDLRRIMPWCGTSRGAESIVKTFVDVSRYWEVLSFERDALFGEEGCAALFGRFTYRSRVLGKTVTSPFAVFAKVREGRCYYLQFMEDTLATSASFRSDGAWTFRSDPNGETVTF
ncbi:MAG: nuclear transport factor 2 family protein [Proteobacteria bacterium]|nr:nuclear transport factor 2 family protein [Pseudomonadota bacterium]